VSEPQAAVTAPAWTPADPEQSVRKGDIESYLPLVHRVVRRVARRLPASVPRDDLLAAGMFGLVDSLRRNGGDRGETFAGYAQLRIRGAIFDELRAQDWLPRRERERLEAIEASAQFVSFDDVSVTEAELALSEDPGTLAEASSQRRALSHALAQLPERERLIVARYYFDGARLKDISAELGVSEPRISQILSRALGRLRALMAA
jgi:RNA polymerase sigma factor for flagellar operon FliA